MASLVPTSVYAIQCGDFIKIGIAADVAARLGELQIGSPHTLTLLDSREFLSRGLAYRTELRIHAALDATGQRRIGEWFRREPTDPLGLLRQFHDEALIEQQAREDRDRNDPVAVAFGAHLDRIGAIISSRTRR